jgi:hypothetical protein
VPAARHFVGFGAFSDEQCVAEQRGPADGLLYAIFIDRSAGTAGRFPIWSAMKISDQAMFLQVSQPLPTTARPLRQTALSQALEVRRGTFGAGYLTLREDQWMAAIFHPAAVRSSTINSTPWLWIGRSR